MNNAQQEATNSAILQNKYRNELILQSIAEGVCVINTEGEITFSNASAEKMLGSQSKNLAGKHYEEILFNRTRNENEICPIRFALVERESSHVNTETFFKADKTEFSVEYICAPLLENDELIGAVITFEDVTERRDVEVAIARARDSALENARLKAAFLANMSHEIRTPLNGIVGTATLLLESNLDSEQKTYVDMLKSSADILLKTVNTILDFSKIEAGKLNVEFIEFNLREIILETSQIYSVLAKQKKLNFSYKIDGKIPYKICGDAKQLQQILNNLLSNAVKFTEKGEIHLKVELIEKNSQKTTLHFSVSDTGIGIDKLAQTHLFQPFMQADVSTTRRFGGTGLGLAICREIVEMMNGKIGVESEIGKGSCFWFDAEFLNIKDKTEFPKIQENILKNTVEIPFDKKNLKILLAEDNEINRQVTLAMFRSIGLEVETVQNGAEAIEKCREISFDLVLMDCQMPLMDGFEATREILSKNFHGKVPKIIALTASINKEEKEKAISVGMIDFLSKPIDKTDLKKIIYELFLERKALQNLDLNEKMFHHSFSEIIAPETLKNFVEIESRGEKNFICEILELFCVYTENGISEIKSAISARKFDDIERKAHSLKGSSLNIGAIKIAKLFETLEQEAQHENLADLQKKTSIINKEFTRIKEIINRNYESREKK